MNYLIITCDSHRGSWGKGKTIAEAAQNAEIDYDNEFEDPNSYVIYQCEHDNFWCTQSGAVGWNGDFDAPKRIHAPKRTQKA